MTARQLRQIVGWGLLLDLTITLVVACWRLGAHR